MNKIKSFKEFLNEFEIDGEYQQGKPLWNGKDYLDENGNINLSNMNLTELPCIFPEVWERGFYCKDNQLTSLEGAPKEVKKSFYCSNNQLTSLEGAPINVGIGFNCDNNQLTSLKGAPKEVGGSFACRNNPTKFSKEDIQRASKVEGTIYV